MTKILLTTLLTTLFATVALSQSREIVWADEFDYEGLPDSDKWSYDVGGSGWGNNELQYYTKDRLENARVENGNLIIEARYENYGGKIYTSARLVTREKGDWKYGYFEMRANLPSGRGTWPAFWMLPTDWEYGGWPDSGEIDIMEHVGYDPPNVVGTVHTEAYNHILGTQVGKTISVPDCESEFHVYACDWTETQIKMYVDGELYFTFNKQSGSEKWPFDKRFHILLNIAVGGNWGGAEGVDNSAFPTQFVIDYVRVYAPGTGPTSLPNDEIQDKIKVYPNPTSANFRVDLSAVESSDPVEISIYDSMGKMIQTEVISNNQQTTQIDISGIPANNYFYVIKSNNEVLKRGSIIKQ